MCRNYFKCANSTFCYSRTVSMYKSVLWDLLIIRSYTWAPLKYKETYYKWCSEYVSLCKHLPGRMKQIWESQNKAWDHSPLRKTPRVHTPTRRTPKPRRDDLPTELDQESISSSISPVTAENPRDDHGYPRSATPLPRRPAAPCVCLNLFLFPKLHRYPAAPRVP